MSDSSEQGDFVFDTLEPQRRNVTVGAKRYVLSEASEDAASKYRNACVRGARMTDGKVTGMEGVGDVQRILLSECLSELHEDGSIVRKVPEVLIRTMPARIVKQLFDWVVKVSELGETPKADERSKNLPDGTKPIST